MPASTRSAKWRVSRSNDAPLTVSSVALTVRVLSAEEVSPAFHARFGARSKTYRYRIWNGDVMSPFERAYAWHVPGPLAVEPMIAAARVLEGTHDFASFQATGGERLTTERLVFSSRVGVALRPCLTAQEGARANQSGTGQGAGEGRLIVYEIAGNGFLRHMVRIIVGTLVEIGRGRRPVEWVDEVLASRDRARAGPTAPAEGLILAGVEYEADARRAEEGGPFEVRLCQPYVVHSRFATRKRECRLSSSWP